MWLLPAFSPVARLALSAFYRFRVEGGSVPADGAALLVANHPNSLLDPAAVVAAAGRPVRFLAKAPLFGDPLVGWLVRGAGAIPIYRQQEGPGLTVRNEDSFRAAHASLRGGDAIGIFPEGLSHSEPSLARLRTGAARIALGAVGPSTDAFPIVPIGLIFPEKGRFRSDGICIVGEPVAWNDLAGRGESDVEAVRELTRRMDDALRAVTINLERREDAQVVLAAERIFNAERGVHLPERERVRALREVSLGLSRLRAEGGEEWLPLARALAAHARKLEALELAPDQLDQPGSRAAAVWTVRQALILGALVLPAAAGWIAYAASYRVTDVIAHRSAPTPDTEATYKLLVGVVAHLLWTAVVATVVALWHGAGSGAAVLLILPLLGWCAVLFRDRCRRARSTAKRFLVRERREEIIEELRAGQAEIATGLGKLRATVQTGR